MQFARAARLRLVAGRGRRSPRRPTLRQLALGRKPPPVEAPPPPPPPPMPDVALGARLRRRRRAPTRPMCTRPRAISPAFTDAAERRPTRCGPASPTSPGSCGAARSPTRRRRPGRPAFVADVRAAGDTPEARYAMVARIFADPTNVAGLRRRQRRGRPRQGSAGAERHAAVRRRRLRCKLAAYAIQHQPWSLTDVADRDGRAATVKQLSNAALFAGRAPRRRPTSTAWSAASRPQPPIGPPPPPYTPLVIRARRAGGARRHRPGRRRRRQPRSAGSPTTTTSTTACPRPSSSSTSAWRSPSRTTRTSSASASTRMKDTGACVVIGAGRRVPIDVVAKPMTIPPPASARPRRDTTPRDLTRLPSARRRCIARPEACI